MSDNELDAELLAMAGDDSDDEGQLDSAIPSAVQSPSPEPKESVEQPPEDPSVSRKGVAQKVRGKGRRKRKQDSDEDDIASPSPAGSLAQSAMGGSDESDAPASPDGQELPLYPIEGKFLSATDKSDIMAMPEIKREEILADRAQEVIKRQQDLQLAKALAATRSAGNKAKRKASAADLEDGGRRTTRPRADKVPTALDKYKAAREQKGAAGGRLDTSKSQKDDKSPSLASDRDAEGESEVEWAEPRAGTRRERDDPPELRDFEKCRVGRSGFAKVCFYPNFETSLKNCFARVSIGMNRETGQNLYRMAQIKGFTEGKPYQIETSDYKKSILDIYVIVAQGSSEKPWPLAACSDSKFTPAELERYEATLRKENKSLPSRKYIYSKIEDIHKLLGRTWTNLEINEKMKKQKAMEQKHDPAYAAKIKRDAIVKRRLLALADGNIDEVDKCDAELAEHAAAQKLKNPAPAVLSQQERMAKVNAHNRTKNSYNVRQALLVEKRKLNAARAEQLKILADAEAAKKAAEEKEKNKLLGIPGDLFGEASDTSRAGTPGVGTPKKSRAGTPANGIQKPRNILGTLRVQEVEEDGLEGLDLGIEIDI